MPEVNPLLQQPSPPPGMINVAPGLSNQTPGQSPAGTGAPVTSYNPATSAASTPGTVGYSVKPFEVTPEQTVVGQIKDIIAAGSPLMQQAEANARMVMNQRGLLNSSTAITAGHRALYDAALPIATPTAATYERAATATTGAINTEAATLAGAKNQASLLGAQLETQTGQFNAGQKNAAMAAAAGASNQVALQAQQIAGAKDVAVLQGEIQKFIEQMRSDTSLTIADKQAAANLALGQLQANTQLSVADKTTATQKLIAELQASTTITTEQARNLTQTAIATMQTDASLTIEQQKVASQQLIASLQAQTTLQQQALQNQGLLANIEAKGAIDTRITQISEANKLLLQSNSGAASLYNQSLLNVQAIMNNPNMGGDQKAVAMNNTVQMLNDGLAAMAAISNTPTVQSNLSFNLDGAGGTRGPSATADQVTAAYQSILGRAPDPGGMEAYLRSGMSAADIAASLRASEEYIARNSAV